MKHFPRFSQLILISGSVFTLFSQPPEMNGMNRPGHNNQMHSDMPPPPRHDSGVAFKPDGILPDPMMLREPIKLKTLLTDIGVNEHSTEQIINLVRNFNKEMEERILKIHKEELNIRGELLKENPDLSAIQKIINKKAQIFAEIEFSQIKRDVGIKKLLTDEEFEMWKSMMVEHMQHAQKLKKGGQKRDNPGSGQKSK